MRYGFQVPNFGAFGDVRAVVELAQRAEAAGWDGFFVWDHIDFHGIEPNADPWMMLTGVALSTDRVKLGPMVTPLPRRHLGKLAREVSTLDALSNGRVILGVGAGDATAAESTAFGESADPRVRAQILEESLEVLCQWWGDGPVDFRGEHLRASIDVTASTVQRPRVPIWVAGTWPNRRPFRRAAQWDGVFPMTADYATGGTTSPADTAEIAAYVRAHFDVAEKDFDVVKPQACVLETPHDVIAGHRDAGATWWIDVVTPLDSLDAAHEYISRGPAGI